MQGGNLVVQNAKGGMVLQFAAGSAHHLHCGAFYAGKLCCLNPHALNMCLICHGISPKCCLLTPLMSPEDRTYKID